MTIPRIRRRWARGVVLKPEEPSPNGEENRMNEQDGSVLQENQEPDRVAEGRQLAVVDHGVDEMPRLARRSTGPRTSAGKERSKRNARKHGIFSSELLLPGESREDLDALRKHLQESFRPVGRAEEILVEKLVMHLWRQRRVIVAESAEIRTRQEFLEQERQRRQFIEAEEQSQKTEKEKDFDPSLFPGLPGSPVGLIWNCENPPVLDRCLELLGELREGFKDRGFSRSSDESNLSKVYGKTDQKHLRETLYEAYTEWAETAATPEDERKAEGYATPAESRKNFLQLLDTEIARLKKMKKEQQALEARRIELEKLRQSVPDGPVFDRLLRYETSIERKFDRTLSQLERLQRMRFGHPVPPPVKLEVTKI